MEPTKLQVDGTPTFESLQRLLNPGQVLLVGWLRDPFLNPEQKVVTSATELAGLHGTRGFRSFSYYAVTE